MYRNSIRTRKQRARDGRSRKYKCGCAWCRGGYFAAIERTSDAMNQDLTDWAKDGPAVQSETGLATRSTT